MKKSKAVGLVLVGLLAAQQAKPDLFGADVGVLTAILGQIEQEVAQARAIYQGVQETRNEITQAANYIQHPQSWLSYLNTAANMAGASNGSDLAELQRLRAMLQATHEAYTQFSYAQLSAGDMARMNQLGLQMMDLQQRADSLNASLQSIGIYQDKVRQSGDWGCISCTIGAHQQ